MALIAFILWLVIAVANVILYGALFIVARYAVKFSVLRIFLLKAPALNWISIALVAIFAFAFPAGMNYLRHQQRANLAGHEKVWSGSLAKAGVIALLTNDREDKNWNAPPECGPRRCKPLLYEGLATAMLIGYPPALDAPPDSGEKVERYRLGRDSWCPAVPRIDDRTGGRNLDELAGMARGQCLVKEPAAVGDADVAIVYQTMTPPRRPNFNTVHEPLAGERLAVYRRDGARWRELFRNTKVGGSDWFVPMLIGPLKHSFIGAMMGAGGLIGFMTRNEIDPKPIDLDAWLQKWGLVPRRNLVTTRPDLTALARKLLADPLLPPNSAAAQFLASYPWFGGWEGRDRAVSAAIIRDSRITDFPRASREDVTPPELARPLLDRIVSTDIGSALARNERIQRQQMITRLAQVFALLPACTAPVQTLMDRIAHDETRRVYAAPLFVRLADDGPQGIADLRYLMDVGLARLAAIMPHRWEWNYTDGKYMLSALQGAQTLGTAGKDLAPTIETVLRNEFELSQRSLANQDVLYAAQNALLKMGAFDALRRAYAGAKSPTEIEAWIDKAKPGRTQWCGS
jgi:hypothetical protein